MAKHEIKRGKRGFNQEENPNERKPPNQYRAAMTQNASVFMIQKAILRAALAQFPPTSQPWNDQLVLDFVAQSRKGIPPSIPVDLGKSQNPSMAMTIESLLGLLLCSQQASCYRYWLVRYMVTGGLCYQDHYVYYSPDVCIGTDAMLVLWRGVHPFLDKPGWRRLDGCRQVLDRSLVGGELSDSDYP
ncbi:hypothetical protein Dimus_034766 [Dionaea muscipula]